MSTGTHPGMIGTPSEQIGYMATEEYAARISSPLGKSKPRARSEDQGASPRRSLPTHEANDVAPDEDEDDEKIHIDESGRAGNKIGGGGYDPPTEDLGPKGGNTEELGGWIHEQGYGTPILASDELAKAPKADWMHPAVAPEQEKQGDNYYAGMDSEHHLPYQSGFRNRSRSRPSNRASSSLSRFVTHESHEGTGTPLAEIEEYEPLFAEDEKDEPKRPLTAADRLKRPELDRRRFPSQDIWEDTPDSLRLETTVSHEQEPDERSPVVQKTSAAAVFESPDKELARKGEILESERLDFLRDPSKGLAKPKFKADLMNEATGRPGLRQRFPSRDIWEDNPDSLELTTEVGESQSDPMSPTSPITRQPGAGMISVDSALKAPAATPQVPARPQAKAEDVAQSGPDIQPGVSSEPRQQAPPSFANDAVPSADFAASERKAPSIPDRPKPSVPPRPARQAGQDASINDASASRELPTGSDPSAQLSDAATSPTLTKAKPAIPARPAQSSKFASLKAGFMNDLNSRLQLGPQAPPKPAPAPADEAEEEKAPLADARKSRARGPQRRKPADADAATSEAQTSPTTAAATPRGWSISAPTTIFHLAPTGPLTATLGSPAPAAPTAASFDERPTASPLARNTAGETLLPATEAPQTLRGALAHPPSEAMDARARRESAEQRERMAPYVEQTIGFAGDVPATAEVGMGKGGSVLSEARGVAAAGAPSREEVGGVQHAARVGDGVQMSASEEQ